jgi:hypothetical protein
MENLTPLFVALTGAAVLLQAGLLAAMYLSMRKSSARLEALANEVKTKALPTLERMDATVNDVVDRARLQIIRGDELLSRTLDRVEETSEMVHNTVVSPVRQFAGLIQGVTAGIEFLLGNRGRKNGNSRESRRPVPQDEMFI